MVSHKYVLIYMVHAISGFFNLEVLVGVVLFVRLCRASSQVVNVPVRINLLRYNTLPTEKKPPGYLCNALKPEVGKAYGAAYSGAAHICDRFCFGHGCCF